MGCHPQEFVDDVFWHKTGVAGCYDLPKKIEAKLVFRTVTVCGIKQNIGVDDERHWVLFHYRFKGFSIGQIDSRTTHIEDR